MSTARTPKAGDNRYRRTDEELIADLKKKIADLQGRVLSFGQPRESRVVMTLGEQDG